MRSVGCSISVELTPDDYYIPYIDEIKKICMEKVGAVCHVTVARKETDPELPILTELSREDYIKTWSTFDSDMISKLKDEIAKIFDLKSIAESNYMYISNARQIALLNNCIDIIGDIDNSVKNNELVDMIEIDVKKLWETLSEITGEVSSDDLLDEIFSKFCLGK